MKIVRVRPGDHWDLFHAVPHLVYREDRNWIPPLRRDIDLVFDSERNRSFQEGEAQCLVALRDGRPVGRLAVFTNTQRNRQQNYPTGGLGFFDCINDQKAAFALFERTEQFCRDRGLKALDGPVNFGERDRFWGLLTRGFLPPLYQENYNPPWYRSFFEDWGFQPYMHTLTFRIDPQKANVGRLRGIAQRACDRHELSAVSLTVGNCLRYAADFAEVYNAAFRSYRHFKPLSEGEVKNLFRSMRPIIERGLAYIAYHRQTPIGLIAFLPEINELVRDFGGRLHAYNQLRLLYRKWTARRLGAKGVAFAIHPAWQNRGIDAFLCTVMRDGLPAKYTHVYLTGIGGHSYSMVRLSLKLGALVEREHITYRKLLTEEVELEAFDFYDFGW